MGGVLLKDEIVLCKLAELEENAEIVSEEEAITAMKALRVLDDKRDEVIFDTGCTAHVLKSGEGLVDLRKATVGWDRDDHARWKDARDWKSARGT
jgi:hypothetical protein